MEAILDVMARKSRLEAEKRRAEEEAEEWRRMTRDMEDEIRRLEMAKEAAESELRVARLAIEVCGLNDDRDDEDNDEGEEEVEDWRRFLNVDFVAGEDGVVLDNRRGGLLRRYLLDAGRASVEKALIRERKNCLLLRKENDGLKKEIECLEKNYKGIVKKELTMLKRCCMLEDKQEKHRGKILELLQRNKSLEAEKKQAVREAEKSRRREGKQEKHRGKILELLQRNKSLEAEKKQAVREAEKARRREEKGERGARQMEDELREARERNMRLECEKEAMTAKLTGVKSLMFDELSGIFSRLEKQVHLQEAPDGGSGGLLDKSVQDGGDHGRESSEKARTKALMKKLVFSPEVSRAVKLTPHETCGLRDYTGKVNGAVPKTNTLKRKRTPRMKIHPELSANHSRPVALSRIKREQDPTASPKVDGVSIE
ncbi:hypothetical protein Droror1_Dr00026179 [Drosera rotundifolia]